MIGDPILNETVPGPRRDSSRGARPPAPSLATGIVASTADSLPPRVARGRARSIAGWLAAGAIIGALLAGTAARAEGANGLRIPPGARQVIAAGRCEWLRPHLAEAGLPVDTFVAIAARESGCRQQPACHVDRDDASCSRWGVNHKTAAMRRTWARWCDAPTMWHTRDLTTDMACVSAAYARMGLRPWR